MKTSQFSGFFKKSAQERLEAIRAYAGLTEEECRALQDPGVLEADTADHMIENVIGRFALPLAVAVNFTINDTPYVIPMVTEEASVVAACSNAAKMALPSGGFFTGYTGSVMIAQIQLLGLPNPHFTRSLIYAHTEKIKAICNEKDPVLVEMGGGFQDLEVRVLHTEIGEMVIVHLLVNTLDAMGANAVNTMAEAVAPYLESVTGGTSELRILSNLADRRLARARAVFSKEAIGGAEVVDGIIAAYAFAAADPYRAATHNKGIMNGITPLVLATGNDTRAIEAGAHAYAARSGRYTSLTVWEKNAEGDLCGSIELPIAAGLVGGATKIHPTARIALKILDVKSAGELAQVMAAVGLAQNMTALKALATDGIQKGHMALHARNIASAVGQRERLWKQLLSR